MQYLWKLTVLGVSQHAFRLVSLDGDLPLDSVLNLCNLSFDYDNYPEKALYFAANDESREVFNKLCPALADNYQGKIDQVEYWKQDVDLASLVESGALIKLDLQEQGTLKLKLASEIISEYLQKAYKEQLEASLDCQPNSLVESAKFFYSLHGVTHLVEVMKSSQKLRCFVPATLAGHGLISDSEQNLSKEMIEAQFASQLAKEEAGEEEIILDLRACTGRMRALQTELASDKVNQVMVQAGATPLKFSSK